MKIAVTHMLCLAALLSLGAAGVALAGPHGGQPMQRMGEGDFRPDFRPRGAEFADERRNQVAEQAQRRNGRLSPDERRELRRQINEAGQDIYRIKR